MKDNDQSLVPNIGFPSPSSGVDNRGLVIHARIPLCLGSPLRQTRKKRERWK